MYRIEYHCFDPYNQPYRKLHSFAYVPSHLKEWQKKVSEDQFETAVLRFIHRTALKICNGKVDGYQVFHMGIPYREAYPWVYFGAIEPNMDHDYVGQIHTRNGDWMLISNEAFICSPSSGAILVHPQFIHPQCKALPAAIGL
jgi:hypothetical protein